MKAFYLFISIVITLYLSSCARINDHHGTTATRIDSLIKRVPDFSGVVLVADHGKTIFHKAYGFRNIEKHIALDTGDIFELASVSKQFTSMIIMMLEEQGKLNFDDSLSKYFPKLPYHGITIRHLLTHTSGVPDYQDVMDKHWDKSKVADNENNIDYLIRFHPPRLFKPGDHYTYSNTGYMLLASIAEKASGEDFIELCRARIFKPLEMTSTDIRTRDEKRSITNFALGSIFTEQQHRYVPADSFPIFNYAIWLGNRKGPGRISSTSNDLLRWDQALYSDKLISQKTLDKAFTPTKLNNDSISDYGFGWHNWKSETLGKSVSHTGDNPGYKTEIVRYIDANKTIIFLCNNAHKEKEAMMKGIKRIVEGL